MTCPKPFNLKKVIFKNIHHGIYAVSVLHDENNNGLMDKNFFGIPTEGYCGQTTLKVL